MVTKQEIRNWIDELKATLPVVAAATSDDYMLGVTVMISIFEREFCGEDGVRKEQ